MSEMYDPKDEAQENEVGLKEIIKELVFLFSYLRTRLLIISLFCLLGAGIGFVYAFLQKPKFVATLSFVLEDDKGNSGFSGALGLASSFGIDIAPNAGGVFNGGNLIELMKSRTLVFKTLLKSVNIDGNETSLIEFYLKFSGIRNKWKPESEFYQTHFIPNSDETKLTPIQNQILLSAYGNLLSNSLSVSQKDKKASIIYVKVNSVNENFAKLFAENLVKVVSDFYIETKSKKAKDNLVIIQSQTDSIRRELNTAMLNVAEEGDNTFNLNQAFNIKRVPSARRQIDVQANSAILTQLVQNLELAKISLRKETPLIQVIDNPILPLESETTGKIKSSIIGGVLSSIICILFLIGVHWYRKILI